MGQKLTFDVVADCGADNSGRDDATAAVERGIKNLRGRIGAALYFPAGVYRISRPLVIAQSDPADPRSHTGNIALSGDGADATTLLFTSADPTQHALTTDVSSFGLRDLRLSTEQFRSVPPALIRAQASDDMVGYRSGAGFYYRGTGNLRIRDVTFDSFMTGVHIDQEAAGQAWITDSDFNNCLIYGLLVENFGGNAFFERLEITGVTPELDAAASVRSARSVGIRINRGDGYQVSDCLISGSGKAALMLKPTRSTPPLRRPEKSYKLMYVSFSNCQFDLPFNTEVSEANPGFGSAVIIDGSISGADSAETDQITRVNFSNCTATAAANNGFYLRGCSRINLTGCSAFVNATHGVRVDAPMVHLSINGGQYFNNSTAHPGTHDGIYLGPGVTDFLVANVKAGLTPGDQQRFGINASSPTNNRYLITGSEATGYPNGGINAQGGPSKVVANNLL